MSTRKKSSQRTVSTAPSEKMKMLTKIIKVLSYATSILLVGMGVFWMTIPNGWIVGVGLLVAALIIAVEVNRVIKA